eukprot:797489-Rhodomonas_salina.3
MRRRRGGERMQRRRGGGMDEEKDTGKDDEDEAKTKGGREGYVSAVGQKSLRGMDRSLVDIHGLSLGEFACSSPSISVCQKLTLGSGNFVGIRVQTEDGGLYRLGSTASFQHLLLEEYSCTLAAVGVEKKLCHQVLFYLSVLVNGTVSFAATASGTTAITAVLSQY